MKYLWTLAAVLIIGCSDNADTTTYTPDSSQSTTVIEMQRNKVYTVSTGDVVKKTSADAEVAITKALEGDTTTVELLSGTAQIIRAN